MERASRQSEGQPAERLQFVPFETIEEELPGLIGEQEREQVTRQLLQTEGYAKIRLTYDKPSDIWEGESLFDKEAAYTILNEGVVVDVAPGAPDRELPSRFASSKGDTLIHIQEAKSKILGEDAAQIPDATFCRLVKTSSRILPRDHLRQINLTLGEQTLTLFDADEVDDFTDHYRIIKKGTSWVIQQQANTHRENTTA